MNQLHTMWIHTNVGGLCFVVLICAFFPVVGTIGWLIDRKRYRRSVAVQPNFSQPVKPARMPPRPDPVAPTPAHVHILDADRSEITVTDIGAVLGTCIVAGCRESIYIAPGVIAIPKVHA